MLAYAFTRLESVLRSGSIFNHTNVEAAENRLKERMAQSPTKVTIGVFGDDIITQPILVCKALIAVLNKVGKKEELMMVIGDYNGTDRIVKRFAEKSGIECIVVKQRTEEAWNITSVPYEEMVDQIVQLSDIIIMLSHNYKNSKLLTYPYELSVQEGCFVIKRIVRSK